jgi:hypothetical protein
MSNSRASTFSGISLAEAKRVVEYEFGDAIIKIEKNDKTRSYEVHIEDKIEKKVVEKFKAHFKKNFTIKVYTFKYEL